MLVTLGLRVNVLGTKQESSVTVLEGTRVCAAFSVQRSH